MRILIPALLLVLAFTGCQEPKQPKETAAAANPVTPFVHPPLPGADVPFDEYVLTAEKGDTIFYPSGSILLFPPNAFADNAGNPIKGAVTLRYRELSNPLDFFLSGVPMSYDSSGKHYLYQSGGMFELKAFKEGIPVFVNPVAKPLIALAGTGNEIINQVYFLDTVQKKWVNKGMAVVAGQSDASGEQPISGGKPATPAGGVLPVPVKPVMPFKPSGNKPEIIIRVEPGSFPELMVYNNLKFELQDADKSWSPKDADEEWSDIKLERVNQKGLYSISFRNKNKTVVYKARPVLEGDDYTVAMKTFETKQKEYAQALSNRLKKDSLHEVKRLMKVEKDRQEEIRLLAENERVRKINELIEARNKLIADRNKQIEAQNKHIIAANKAREIMYSFEVDGFGVWNCDRMLPVKLIEMTARFTDSAGKEIALYSSATVISSPGGIMENRFDRAYALPGADNMILGVMDGRLAYFSYEAFRNLHITPETKEQIFRMTILPEGMNKYEDIKKVIGPLK